ncbi:glycosyltransferase family 4 protein [Gemmatimonas sp.]|uniref:glycosyltransferase family 4 protein n=1 Tax=Gemmatimonas sp. TaxID=1962908 RepID=UPI003DA5BC70
MRILLCTDTYPPQLNGVSVVVAGMVAGLRARGWDCTVVSPSYPSSLRDLLHGDHGGAQYTVPSIPCPGYPDIRLAWPSTRNMRRLIEQLRPDMVLSATEGMVGRAGSHAARDLGLPLITSYHTDFSRYCDAYGLPWMRPFVSSWLTRFHARADATLTPSHASRRQLQELGIHHTRVWSGGVDIDQFHPRHYAATARYRFALGHAFTFLYVGRLAPEKNLELLLKAFAKVSRSRPGRVRLLIVGAGPCEAALRARAPDGVSLLGALDRRNDLPSLYASAEAFLFASTTETLGLVTLEAMASGLPVIAVPVGGVGDYLQDGRNGLAFDANDVDGCAAAMIRLCDDPSLNERLRAGARQTAERYGNKAELDRLDATMRDIIRAHGQPVRASGSLLLEHAAPDSR